MRATQVLALIAIVCTCANAATFMGVEDGLLSILDISRQTLYLSTVEVSEAAYSVARKNPAAQLQDEAATMITVVFDQSLYLVNSLSNGTTAASTMRLNAPGTATRHLVPSGIRISCEHGQSAPTSWHSTSADISDSRGAAKAADGINASGFTFQDPMRERVITLSGADANHSAWARRWFALFGATDAPSNVLVALLARSQADGALTVPAVVPPSAVCELHIGPEVDARPLETGATLSAGFGAAFPTVPLSDGGNSSSSDADRAASDGRNTTPTAPKASRRKWLLGTGAGAALLVHGVDIPEIPCARATLLRLPAPDLVRAHAVAAEAEGRPAPLYPHRVDPSCGSDPDGVGSMGSTAMQIKTNDPSAPMSATSRERIVATPDAASPGATSATHQTVSPQIGQFHPTSADRRFKDAGGADRPDGTFISAIELEDLVEAGIPGLDIIVKGVIGTVIDPIASQIISCLVNEVSDKISDSTAAGTGDSCPTDIAMVVNAKVAYNLNAVLTDSITQQTVIPMTDYALEVLTPDLTVAVSNNLVPKLRHHLSKVLTKTIADRVNTQVPEAVSRSLLLSLTETLTRSVTHAVVPTLTQALSYDHKQDIYCWECFYRKTHCGLCHYSPYYTYHTNYYSAYYSDYYSTYYADYYADAVRRVDEQAFPKQTFEDGTDGRDPSVLMPPKKAK